MNKGHGAVQLSVTVILRTSDHLSVFSPSEGNIASEDSSLSDALVLEDGMLAAVCSRGQEEMGELLIDAQNGRTILCNNPLKAPSSKTTWFPLTPPSSQTSGLKQ